MEHAVLLRETESEKSDNKLKDKFSRLVRLQQLQKSIVRQNMHNAMSPLSAISGYLDLIGMTLEQEASVDQIEYYRKKIETGISEVNAILEQLHEVYKTEVQADEELLEVDLNWTVRDVCSHIKSSSTQIIFEDSYSPLHIKTSLYTAKLIIYKIIMYAVKSSGKKQDVMLSTEKEDGMAKLNVSFHISQPKVNDINAVLGCENPKDEFECINQSSLNEGLLASNKLTSQIGGEMRFSCDGDNKGRLTLNLPLN
jgi:signal transduction histidine kinase